MDNSKASQTPLHPEDTPTQTFGCRLSNPNSCLKHSLPQVCAFVRNDGLCLSPPKTWSNTYRRLKEKGG